MVVPRLELVTGLLSETASAFDQAGRLVDAKDAAGMHGGTVYYPDGRTRYGGVLKEGATLPDPIPADFDPAAYFESFTIYAYDRFDADAKKLYDAVTDPLGRTTRTYRDVLGRAVKTVYHDASFTETVYGLANQPADLGATADRPAIDLPADFPATFDGRHEVKVEQRKAGEAVAARHHLYDASGRLTDVWQPAVYDADPASATYGLTVRPHWKYEYDDNGNLVAQTDPRNNVTRFAYDEHGRRTGRTLPDDGDPATNEGESWVYEPHGQVKLHKDFNGHTTWSLYDDGLGRSGRLDREYRYAFDFTPGATDDPEGAHAAGTASDWREKTVRVYDDASLPAGEQLRLGRVAEVQEWQRDASNTAVQTWTTHYTYDRFTGGVASAASYEGPSERYDPPPPLVGVVSYQYNAATGRLVRTWTDRTETAYGYDRHGRLEHVYQVKINGDAGGVSVSGWDAAAQEPTFAGGTPPVTRYAYDAAGNLNTVTLPNGVVSDYDYDVLNRLDFLTVRNGSGNLFTQDYALLSDGQRDYVVERRYSSPTTFSETKIDWTYDALDRLEAEVRDEGNDGPGADLAADAGDYKHGYAFDLAGNRITKTIDNGNDGTDEDVVTSTYDARDRLLTVDHSDAAVADETYGYDENGNTTSVTLSTGPVKKYVWDLRERLAGYDANGDDDTADVGDATYAYDTGGVRVKATEVTAGGDVHTYFLQDTNNLTGYSQVLEESATADPTDTPTRSYVIGADVLAQATPAAGTQYLMYDAGGSTRGLLTTSGGWVSGQNYDYDAHGTLLSPPTTVMTPLLYRGEYFVSALGQYQLRARYYRPSIGRFTSFDSYEGSVDDPVSLHKYVYASNNPIYYLDPTGQFSKAELLVVVGLTFLLEALFTPNVANAPAPGDARVRDKSGDQVFDMLASVALAPPLRYLGVYVLNPAFQWVKSFFPRPRAVPLGTIRLGADEAARKAAAWVKPQPGYTDVIVHGSEDAFWVLHKATGQWIPVNQRSLGTYMRANGYTGGDVRLLSCSTGKLSDGVAQDLSNKLVVHRSSFESLSGVS